MSDLIDARARAPRVATRGHDSPLEKCTQLHRFNITAAEWFNPGFDAAILLSMDSRR